MTLVSFAPLPKEPAPHNGSSPAQEQLLKMMEQLKNFF
jgi:hypothetical protein